MLWQHFTISAAAGLSKVRTSPPKLWVRPHSRSTVERLRAPITVIQGNRKSSRAVAARRNSGLEASANPWLTRLPESCSSSSTVVVAGYPSSRRASTRAASTSTKWTSWPAAVSPLPVELPTTPEPMITISANLHSPRTF
jgi:hypothetical protein